MLGLVEIVEHLLAHRRDVLALVGQREAPVSPFDQRPPDAVFELADGVADRRLRHVQAPGGDGVVAAPGRLEEDLEPADVEPDGMCGHGASPRGEE